LNQPKGARESLGEEKWLRSRGTLFALQKLHDKGHISGKEHHNLTKAYEFFRNLEHRLQLRHGQQRHQLPTSDAELAVLAAGVPDVGIGYAGVALAFGLTVLTGAYALGNISGGHFNPAVTLGLFTAGRFPAKDVIPYWIVQVLGGLAAGAVLYAIASGTAGFDASAGFASNGYGEHSPQGYSMMAGAVCEIVMTFMFLIVILGVTSYKDLSGFAPIAIGLALTLIHLISIPVTNTSVNPNDAAVSVTAPTSDSLMTATPAVATASTITLFRIDQPSPCVSETGSPV
jgi:aquaporin Z